MNLHYLEWEKFREIKVKKLAHDVRIPKWCINPRSIEFKVGSMENPDIEIFLLIPFEWKNASTSNLQFQFASVLLHEKIDNILAWIVYNIISLSPTLWKNWLQQDMDLFDFAIRRASFKNSNIEF